MDEFQRRQPEHVFEQLIALSKQRMTESIRWHQRRGSIGSKHQLREIAAKHEREHLDAMADDFDEQDQSELADWIRRYSREVLPLLVHELH